MSLNEIKKNNYFNFPSIKINENIPKNNIAIIVSGQLRTFFEIYENFKIFIEKIKNEFKKVIIFFYISYDSSFKSGWQYNKSINKFKNQKSIDELKKIVSNYNTNETYFKNFIKDINCTYIIKEKNISNYKSTHLIQLEDFQNVLKIITNYEKNNKINFNYIVKTRPDLKYDNNFNVSNLFHNNKIFYKNDLIFFLSRQISRLYENNIDNIINYFNRNEFSDIIEINNLTKSSLLHYIIHISIIHNTYINILEIDEINKKYIQIQKIFQY
jgi:hypothetical protein